MSESGEARRDGSTLQRNSGRGQYSKGDAKREFFLVDYKEYSKSFSVSIKSWAKVCTDAVKVNRDLSPLIKLILGEGAQKVRVAILAWSMFEEMERIYIAYRKGELVWKEEQG